AARRADVSRAMGHRQGRGALAFVVASVCVRAHAHPWRDDPTSSAEDAPINLDTPIGSSALKERPTWLRSRRIESVTPNRHDADVRTLGQSRSGTSPPSWWVSLALVVGLVAVVLEALR